MTGCQDRNAPLLLSGRDLADLVRPLLEEGRSCRFVSGGYSMHPFVRNRDTIVLAPVNRKSPELGDILACIHPETSAVIVHRVIQCKPGYVLLKGDNNLRPDGWLPLDAVCGRVTTIERKGKPVYLGLGPERKLMALASRRHRLMRVLSLPFRVWGRISNVRIKSGIERPIL
jgi:signal peptidase I